MWKEILSCAVLILSMGVSVHLVSQANALPEISLGSNPTASFGGVFTSSSQVVVTTSSAQAFVVKTMFFDGLCTVYVGSDLVLSQNSAFTPALYWHSAGSSASVSGSSAFQQGRANLTVPAGSTLSIQNCNGNRFYIDGYYVHP